MNNMSFKEYENKWLLYWSTNNTYKWEGNDSDRDNIFVLDTPPPTASGSGIMHMGHAFSYTHFDIIARYQRMKGKHVFYPLGIDNNGLPTERAVEKIHNIKSKEMNRSEFEKLCYETIVDFKTRFNNFFKKIGMSNDNALSYETISKSSQEISQMSFIDLYNKGYIYRKFGPTYWDIFDQTAIAQAEIVDKEAECMMYDIQFQLVKEFTTNYEENFITISTTRPELISACIVIFVHPNDDRYVHLINSYAETPIFKQKVKIMADEAVLMDKGTGAVMCCTFGDIQDIYWWRKYNLHYIECIDENGRMKNSFELNNLKISEANKKIVDMLKEIGVITKETNIIHNVKCSERSGAKIEIIMTAQWYIDVLSHKEKLLEQSNKVLWWPQSMKYRLDNWISGLNQNWCISRQRNFGVKFPVWYSKKDGEKDKIILPEILELPIDPSIDLPKGYTRDEVTYEECVMDTWATSALTPQISSRGISSELYIDQKKHNLLFPCDLRAQAHEIIRIWAFGTIVKAFYHQNAIPWKNIMVSGWCLSYDKSKMSKSKGNLILPEKIIDEYGADALRYWCSKASLGVDTTYSEDVVKNGKRLVTKLINASKFCKQHFDKSEIKKEINESNICEKVFELAQNPIDIWIVLKLSSVLKEIDKYFEVFEYSSALLEIETFFWQDLCDNYLEIIKSKLYQSTNINEENYKGSITALYYILQSVVKFFAPFIPFVTEEIYQQVFTSEENTNESIHQRGMWPKLIDYFDKNTNFSFECKSNKFQNENFTYTDHKNNINQKFKSAIIFVDILRITRRFKSEEKIALNHELKSIEIFFKNQEEMNQFLGVDKFDLALSDIKNATCSKDIIFKKGDSVGGRKYSSEFNFDVEFFI